MLVIHAQIEGKTGHIEKTYDLLRNDGKDEFTGTEVLIPYNAENDYPITERDAIAILANQEMENEYR